MDGVCGAMSTELVALEMTKGEAMQVIMKTSMEDICMELHEEEAPKRWPISWDGGGHYSDTIFIG